MCPDSSSHPDFLCIGAQRAGTTWLAANLARHPELWLTPHKELHYWNHPNQGVPQWLLEWRLMTFNHYYGGMVKTGQFNLPLLAWMARMAFTQHQDDQWYLSLFQGEGAGRLKGEITPAYSAMDDDQVGHLTTLLPHVKILFILRDPMERVWSQILFDQRKGYYGREHTPFPKQMDEAFFRTHMGLASSDRRTDYPATLARWERFVPAERLGCFFYDNLATAPAQVLAGICEFLGVGFDLRHFADTLTLRVNTGARQPRPPLLDRLVAEKYLDRFEPLAHRFGEPVTTWVERMRRARD